MPSSGAPASPAAGRADSRLVRCSSGSQPRKPSPTSDRDDAEHPVEHVGVLEHAAGPARRTPSRRRRRRRVKPSTNSSAPSTMRAARGRPRCAPRSPSSPTAGRCGSGDRRGADQPGDVGEVAGHQRQHAGRGEADQPDERRDAGRHEQRAVGDEASGRSHPRHSPPRRTGRARVRRSSCDTVPVYTAATRPSRVQHDGGRDRVRRVVPERQGHLAARVVQRRELDAEAVDERRRRTARRSP